MLGLTKADASMDVWLKQKKRPVVSSDINIVDGVTLQLTLSFNCLYTDMTERCK